MDKARIFFGLIPEPNKTASDQKSWLPASPQIIKKESVKVDSPKIPNSPKILRNDSPKIPRNDSPEVESLHLSQRANLHRSRSQNKVIVEDIRSIEYFKRQNLHRGNFSYDILTDIGWWPDEILTFLEILRLSYTDFINTYISSANEFDVPIRNAIYFMHQKQYNKIPDIEKFTKYGNFEIPDNYLNLVISEDNCYMHEIEERSRSINEKKHFLLSKALDRLLTIEGISSGDLILQKEHENKIRIYLSIYNLRNAYSVIDDALRNIISASLNKHKMHISIFSFIQDMINDIDDKVISHFRKINDHKLFNKVYLFKDLLYYILYNSIQFNYTFTFHRDITGDLDNIDKVSPFSNDKVFTDELISRIQYVYKYHLLMLVERYQKNKKILEITNINNLVIDNSKSISSNMMTPRYIPKTFSSIGEKSEGTFIIDIKDNQEDEAKIKKRLNHHLRKYSVDAIVSPRGNFRMSADFRRQDTPPNGKQ
jgi:hypothetical protein